MFLFEYNFISKSNDEPLFTGRIQQKLNLKVKIPAQQIDQKVPTNELSVSGRNYLSVTSISHRQDIIYVSQSGI